MPGKPRPAVRLVAVLATIACLGACATNTAYGPIENGVGYSDFKIEENRIKISFLGGNDASRSEVEGFALRRAAELTLENGHEWFRVVDKHTETITEARNSGTGVGVGVSGVSGRTGVGVGVGIDLTPDRIRYETNLEILTGARTKPDGDDVYDASSILATIEQ